MSESHSVVATWALLTSWFTPTILFCIMNLMIGTIFITSNLKSKKQLNQDGHDQVNQNQLLARAPSLIDRVKSINFSIYKPYPLDPETTQQPYPRDQHVTRSKSEASDESPAEIRAIMRKSASEKSMANSFEEFEEIERRRPATMRERRENTSKTASSGDDEAVDAKADDFINKFKQQLRMQRLDSLIRYRELFGK